MRCDRIHFCQSSKVPLDGWMYGSLIFMAPCERGQTQEEHRPTSMAAAAAAGVGRGSAAPSLAAAVLLAILCCAPGVLALADNPCAPAPRACSPQTERKCGSHSGTARERPLSVSTAPLAGGWPTASTHRIRLGSFRSTVLCAAGDWAGRCWGGAQSLSPSSLRSIYPVGPSVPSKTRSGLLVAAIA